MAKIRELDQEGWAAWVAGCPESVQELCRRFPPDRLYRMTPTGQRCTIISYSEGGTLTVAVTGEYNLTMFDRQVFGIKPEDLTECDLPGPDDPLGAMLTEREDVEAFIDESRSELHNQGKENG